MMVRHTLLKHIVARNVVIVKDTSRIRHKKRIINKHTRKKERKIC